MKFKQHIDSKNKEKVVNMIYDKFGSGGITTGIGVFYDKDENLIKISTKDKLTASTKYHGVSV